MSKNISKGRKEAGRESGGIKTASSEEIKIRKQEERKSLDRQYIHSTLNQSLPVKVPY